MLGIITMGNIKDAMESFKNNARVCIIYDRESEAYVRNFILEEKLDVTEYLHLKLKAETNYYDSLKLFAKYDANKLVDLIYVNGEDTKPLLCFCHEEQIREHPVKLLALLQSQYDVIYLM